jgi:hypothetical protein
MTRARAPRKKNNLLADDRFNPVGHRKISIFPDIAPNLDEIERRFRRKNVASPHSGLVFSLAR